MNAHLEDMNEELEAIKTRIRAFLIDYSDGNLKVLERLTHYKKWPLDALDAARNRIFEVPHRILQGLATDALEAIANRKVDVAALAFEALQTLEKQAFDADNRRAACD